MRKAARVLMRTWVIGDMPRGYTLIEVLAVIALLLLTLLLVTPNWQLSGERYQVESVRRLLTSDLQLLRDESLAGVTTAEIEFAKDGYVVWLEEREIVREFRSFHILFAVDAVGEAPPEASTSPAAKFSFDRAVEPTPLVIAWRSPHLRGVLTIKTDTTLEWQYEQD
jgi:prepilin-type N-terminal cleavage/methylation domain-containing protein